MEFRRPMASGGRVFFASLSCKQFAIVSLLLGLAGEILEWHEIARTFAQATGISRADQSFARAIA
jgi:hypothetical protein